MGKQERASRLGLIELLINVGYYVWTLYLYGTWDLASVDHHAFGRLLLTCVVIGITFEALNHQLLRRGHPGEVLEDERDRAIAAAGTALAFKLCIAGLFALAWQIFIQAHLPAEAMLPPALLAHLPLFVLALAFAGKYGLQIWLYWRDRADDESGAPV